MGDREAKIKNNPGAFQCNLNYSRYLAQEDFDLDGRNSSYPTTKYRPASQTRATTTPYFKKIAEC